MRTFFKTIIFCLLATVSFGGCAQQPNNSIDGYRPLIDKYRKIFLSEMKKNEVVGMSIALVYGDSIIWAEGLGYKDLNNKIKATAEDQYLIASLTKTFTGLGVMQLQQNGKINIDDPLKKYLAEFNIKMLSGNINDIKIRQIMTHHSGMPTEMLSNMFTKNPEPMNEMINYMNRDYLSLPPGKNLMYSNSAVSLLGSMIEKVSGIKYIDYIKANIFNPLEMNSTGFFTANNKPDGIRFAYDYNGKMAEELPLITVPASSIFSNVLDMSKYIKTILNYGKYNNKQIIDSTELCKMFELQNGNIPLDLGRKIGLIWFINNNDAGMYIEHDGATLHHRAYIAIAPQSRLGVIVLSNSENSGGINWRGAELMAEAAKINGFKPKKIPDADSLSPHSNKLKFEKITLSSGELLKYTGIYSNPFMCFNIKSSGSSLQTMVLGHKVILEPLTGNNFTLKTKILGLIPIRLFKDRFIYFDTIQGEKVLISRYYWGGKELAGVKQEPAEISNAWKQRCGKYKIINQKEGSISCMEINEMKINDGILTMSVVVNNGKPQKLEMPFIIINDSLAQSPGYGRNAGNKLQVLNAAKNSEYLQFWGYELKKE